MTSLTVSQVQDLQTIVLLTEASNWSRASRWAEDARDVIEQQMLMELKNREGETVTTAVERLTAVAENCDYIRVQCGLVQTSLNTLAEELNDARQRLQSALDEAAEFGYTVADDGSVTYPAVTEADGTVVHEGGTASRQGFFDSAFSAVPDLLQGPHQAAAQDLATRIGNALNDVELIDSSYESAISQLETENGVLVTPEMWADAARDTEAVSGAARGAVDASNIPQGMSPQENRDWWNALDPTEEEVLIALFPAEIGAMDGLPAEVRDQANRGVLQMEYGRVSEELEQHLANEPEDPGLWWIAQKEYMEQQLASMDALQNRFAQTGEGGLPEAYLLGLDIEGDGQYIVANGNPDTADHTAVFVPGTTSDLAGAEGDIGKMTNLWRETSRSAPGESVSTITWLGYNAPDEAMPIFLGGEDLIPEAASDSWARDAAPDFSAFTDGLRTAHMGEEPSHTTLIGHSYGSSVIGAAALDGGLYADDVVAVGSPGMFVDDAGELGVGSDHVWSMAAGVRQDQVPAAGAAFTTFGGGGLLDIDIEMTGPWGVPSIDWDDSGPQVPSMESFGANIMATNSVDHSGYWKPDTISLENQAQVVLKRYDEVELG
jgi:pimeloyl-ACP methyl ester carboxylesterase